MRRKIYALAALFLAICLVMPSIPAEAASKIRIDKPSKTLYLNADNPTGISDTYDFSIKNIPKNQKIKYSFKWYTDDEGEDNVDVTKEGVVTAKEVGEATIYCKIIRKKDTQLVKTCKATVTVKANAETVTITTAPENNTMPAGGTFHFNRTMKAANEGSATDKTEWSTTDNEMLTIDKKGVATARKPGKASVICKTYQSKSTKEKEMGPLKGYTAESDSVEITIQNAIKSTSLQALNKMKIELYGMEENVLASDIKVTKASSEAKSNGGAEASSDAKSNDGAKSSSEKPIPVTALEKDSKNNSLFITLGSNVEKDTTYSITVLHTEGSKGKYKMQGSLTTGDLEDITQQEDGGTNGGTGTSGGTGEPGNGEDNENDVIALKETSGYPDSWNPLNLLVLDETYRDFIKDGFAISIPEGMGQLICVDDVWYINPSTPNSTIPITVSIEIDGKTMLSKTFDYTVSNTSKTGATVTITNAPDNNALPVNTTFDFEYEATPPEGYISSEDKASSEASGNDMPIWEDKAEWSSSNTDILSINKKTGETTALALGKAEVTCKLYIIDDLTDARIYIAESESVEVTVQNIITGITVQAVDTLQIKLFQMEENVYPNDIKITKANNSEASIAVTSLEKDPENKTITVTLASNLEKNTTYNVTLPHKEGYATRYEMRGSVTTGDFKIASVKILNPSGFPDSWNDLDIRAYDSVGTDVTKIYDLNETFEVAVANEDDGEVIYDNERKHVFIASSNAANSTVQIRVKVKTTASSVMSLLDTVFEFKVGEYIQPKTSDDSSGAGILLGLGVLTGKGDFNDDGSIAIAQKTNWFENLAFAVANNQYGLKDNPDFDVDSTTGEIKATKGGDAIINGVTGVIRTNYDITYNGQLATLVSSEVYVGPGKASTDLVVGEYGAPHYEDGFEVTLSNITGNLMVDGTEVNNVPLVSSITLKVEPSSEG